MHCCILHRRARFTAERSLFFCRQVEEHAVTVAPPAFESEHIYRMPGVQKSEVERAATARTISGSIKNNLTKGLCHLVCALWCGQPHSDTHTHPHDSHHHFMISQLEIVSITSHPSLYSGAHHITKQSSLCVHQRWCVHQCSECRRRRCRAKSRARAPRGMQCIYLLYFHLFSERFRCGTPSPPCTAECRPQGQRRDDADLKWWHFN